MSIFSSIGGAIQKIGGSLFGAAKTALPGAVGGAIAGGLPGAILGGGMSVLGGGMKTLPPIPGVAGSGGGGAIVRGTLGGLAGGAARRIGSAARGAASMCARFPQWCVAVGGVSAIAAMMQSGQLPVPKRRRRRGITPRDLQSFRRVAGLIKSYGPTARRVPSSCAPRKRCK
jgi:hypothetical protein